MKELKIVIVGAGVAGYNAATKLVKEGYPPDLITVIDAGKDPYKRQPEEVMKGSHGAGLFSDGKWVYLHNTIGGHLAKYTGEEKADQLLDEAWSYIIEFHPDPSKIMFSNPIQEPEFIKPYFNLRMAPTWHVGTNYLHDMGKRWYDYLVEKGVNFEWETEVTHINFKWDIKVPKGWYKNIGSVVIKNKQNKSEELAFNKLIYGTGKSGIDLTQKLIDNYNLKKEPKSIQLGVRMELPQKYMQPIVDVSYDFKLYQKPNDKVSIRSFCSNNFAAYVAEEETYGMKSYNGHSYKQEDMVNNMTNFGIIMEIKGINNPFEYQKQAVSKCQINGKGLYYSPNKTRKPSLSAEKHNLNVVEIDSLDIFKNAYGEYAQYIINYIDDLNKVFNFNDDFGIYIPEVKYLSEEVLVNYDDLSLINYPDIHFVGDSLSSRGIAVSAAQGVYAAAGILNKCKQ
jgi:uncharacterized FAD-dependent dehydrogenase